jgi:uncharacterized protein Usg
LLGVPIQPKDAGLEGLLHSVRVAHCKLIKPAELKAVGGEFRLH